MKRAVSIMGKEKLPAVFSAQFCRASLLVLSNPCCNLYSTGRNPNRLILMHGPIEWRTLVTDSKDRAAAKAAREAAKLNKLDNYGLNHLMRAAKAGNEEMVEVFIAKGIDVNLPSSRGAGGRTALMMATRRGFVSCVARLIAAGSLIDAKDHEGQTALMYALAKGHTACAQLLIRAGATLAVTDAEDRNAFMHAARGGHIACIDLLIQAGADINEKSKVSGFVPLIHAALKGKKGCVAAMLLRGADINCTTKRGWSALMTATMAQKPDSMMELAEAGADMNIKDNTGYTALIIAVMTRNPESVRFLIDAGADVNCRNDNGWTATIQAAYDENIACLEVLIAANADINVKDSSGATALMFAAHRDTDGKCVKALIKAGALFDDQSEDGSNALMVAALEGKIRNMSMLIAAGCNTLLKDNKGRSALDYATDGGNVDAVRLLRKVYGTILRGSCSPESSNNKPE